MVKKCTELPSRSHSKGACLRFPPHQRTTITDFLESENRQDLPKSHPLDSSLPFFFWLLQQFQQLRCNIRSLSRTLHFPSFLVVMCSPLPVSKMQMFRALQANLLCSASKRHGWQAHFTSWNPAFRRASLHNSPGNITRARRHLGMRPWNLAVPVVYRYIYLQTAWLQVKTWSPGDVRNGAICVDHCWPAEHPSVFFALCRSWTHQRCASGAISMTSATWTRTRTRMRSERILSQGYQSDRKSMKIFNLQSGFQMFPSSIASAIHPAVAKSFKFPTSCTATVGGLLKIVLQRIKNLTHSP